MITAKTVFVSALQLVFSPSPRFKSIIATAFLSFGLVVPSAFAKCYSAESQHSVITPAVAATLVAERPDASTLSSVPVSIVGLWNVTFSSGGETVDVAFDAWHSDGTEILNDYTNPIEGNVCLGVWVQIGPRTYKLKHPSWSFDTTGTLQGTVMIRETVTVSPDGNSYSGNYAYDIYDTSGNFIVEYTGQIKASRIKPD